MSQEDTFAARLEAVERRIVAACERSGRLREDVTLVAVSKTFGPEDVREAVDCGLSVFGESRVQEARQKIPLCPGNLDWQLIGHLQRNKVREAVRLFGTVHSVDSWRLLEALDEGYGEAGRRGDVCLEINVSGEASKFGMPPSDVAEVLARASELMNVTIVGLMTIPPFTPDAEDARPFFRRLRDLRERCREQSGVELSGLSMGMSHDYEVAIEEGATWVRVGTALFGRRSRRAPGSVGADAD